MKMAVALLVALFCTGLFAQPDGLPKIAVYVTGNLNESESQALGTEMLNGLVRSGRFTAAERSAEFMAEIAQVQAIQPSGSVDDGQISRLGKQFGVQFVCIAGVAGTFGSHQVSARIVDVETAKARLIGRASGQLNSAHALETLTAHVINSMFGGSPILPIPPPQAAPLQPQAGPIRVAQAMPPQPQPTPVQPEPAPVPESIPTRAASDLGMQEEPMQVADEKTYDSDFRMSIGLGGFFAGDFGGGAAGISSKEFKGTYSAMPWIGGGANAFFDASYAEIGVGFTFASGKFVSKDPEYGKQEDDEEYSLMYLNLSLLGKYPIYLDGLSIWPAAGIEYALCISGEYDGRDLFMYNTRYTISDINQLWIKFGIGMDTPLNNVVFLRTKLLYGIGFGSKLAKNEARMVNDDIKEYTGRKGDVKAVLSHGLQLGISIGFNLNSNSW